MGLRSYTGMPAEAMPVKVTLAKVMGQPRNRVSCRAERAIANKIHLCVGFSVSWM
jgi:hypothetical protein